MASSADRGEPAGSGRGDGGARRRVLLLVAKAGLRDTLVDPAVEAGFGVIEAGSVAEGVDGFRDEAALVLLDASFADDAGPLMERARASDTPVLVAGVASQEDQVLGLIEVGARGYVPLPRSTGAIAEQIRNTLAREEERPLETTGIGQAKKDLQAVFDIFPSALVVVGPDLVIRRSNRAALSLSGSRVLSTLKGLDICDVIGCRTRDERRPLARAVRSNREAEFDVEASGHEGRPARVYHCRVFPGDAEPGGRDVRSLAGPDQPGRNVRTTAGSSDLPGRNVRTAAGSSDLPGLGDGALVLIEDATHLRREEADHARSQQLEAVTLLAGSLSHEINQPLNTILGRAQLVLMCLDEESVDRSGFKRDMEEIIQCVHRVTGTLEKLHRVTEIVTKPYLGETEILDLDRSAERR